MHAQLVKPRDPALQSLVESFLFLWTDEPEGAYTTFPNTNLCLALYNGNEAAWDRTTNQCVVRRHPRAWSSKLYGFHQQPFKVRWNGPVRQVNILFKPGALGRFAPMPVHLIDAVDDPLTELFGARSEELTEQLFSGNVRHEQMDILERFLRMKLRDVSRQDANVMAFLSNLDVCRLDAGPAVRELARRVRTSPSTIYRNFMHVVGQAPQAFFRTVRFRKALGGVLDTVQAGTSIALDHGYYDQAHFIKEMRRFAGASPVAVRRNAEVVPGGFVWVRP